MTVSLQPGKLVTLRGRDWIVLPSDDPDLLVVKPLGGSDDEIAGIYRPLGVEADEPDDAQFHDPSKADLGDISTARLLYDSARLAFRNGAGPFRSLAKLSFRPRSCQDRRRCRSRPTLSSGSRAGVAPRSWKLDGRTRFGPLLSWRLVRPSAATRWRLIMIASDA